MSEQCDSPNCERIAKRELKPGSVKLLRLGKDAPSRLFCEPCYHAWRRGAKTTFTNGVPQGSRINE